MKLIYIYKHFFTTSQKRLASSLQIGLPIELVSGNTGRLFWDLWGIHKQTAWTRCRV